jgi:uncharacterized membrane protein YgcG
MRKRIGTGLATMAFAALFICAALPARAQAQTSPPGPQPLSPAATLASQYPVHDYVNDYASVLDADMRGQLLDAAKQLEQQHKVRVNFVTVKTINGATIADFSMAVGNNWQAHHPANQRNIQILLDIDERKMRFDVCRSLESTVSDADANGILQDMTPMLREGEYGRALLAAIQDLGDLLTEKERSAPTAGRPVNPQVPPSPPAPAAPPSAPPPPPSH